jgi:hypothetical protein
LIAISIGGKRRPYLTDNYFNGGQGNEEIFISTEDGKGHSLIDFYFYGGH